MTLTTLSVDLLPPGNDAIDRISAALSRNNSKALAVVEAACRQLGPPVVPWLVDEAVAKGARADRRLNCLEMLKRLGLPIDLDDATRIATLLEDRSAVVRIKTIELFDALKGSPTYAYFYFSLLPPRRRAGKVVPPICDPKAMDDLRRALMAYTVQCVQQIRNDQAASGSGGIVAEVSRGEPSSANVTSET